jgi:hypothetical protein
MRESVSPSKQQIFSEIWLVEMRSRYSDVEVKKVQDDVIKD